MLSNKMLFQESEDESCTLLEIAAVLGTPNDRELIHMSCNHVNPVFLDWVKDTELIIPDIST